MEKNYLIQLTNNLYRLTLLFPKKEPLRYKMREIAADIFANLTRGPTSGKSNKQHPVLLNLEVLDGFFEVAKSQNWVAAVDVLRLQEEYNRIKAEIKKNTTASRDREGTDLGKTYRGPTPAKLPEVRPRQILNERQEKILEFLRENGRAQVWQLKQIFPEVSKRTLRRDFESLLKQGIIERVGERNDTFYQIKRSQAPLEVGQG